MADTGKRQRTRASTQVHERFESGVRLCEDAPASEVRFLDDLEVQDPARRAHVGLAIELHASSRSHFFCGLNGDVAEGGVFISTYHPFVVGSVVHLELSLRGVDATVRTRGEVRWIREHTSHAPRGVGIAFCELSDEDRYHVYDFCSMRPALYYDDVG